jgi:hypothetical protein
MEFSFEMYLLLIAYTNGRNKTQVQDAIAEYCKPLSMGRHIIPLTAYLLEQEWIETIDSKEKGHFSKTTEMGLKVMSSYEKRLESIANFKRGGFPFYLGDFQQL